MHANRTLSVVSAALLTASLAAAQASSPPAGNGQANNAPSIAPGQSPAARPRPKAVTPQSYSADLIQAGETRFTSQCGFCHGRDAAGGETGPDLTRSDLVAQDTRGDKIGRVVRSGRADAGMPAFQLTDAELDSIVAFIHSQMDKFASLGGGRRSVDPSDLATGNADAGRAYFNGAGGCAACHSATGDLAGVATRYKGLALLQRMLYPSGRPAPASPIATFTLASGQKVIASVAAEDEFSVTVLDPQGTTHTYQKDAVKVTVENPLSAHFVQLGHYTDATMHDVFAYLDTLK